MAVDKTLVSGSMAMLLLKLLSEKDMYGYEMIDTLRKRSQNVFELKAGSMYPLLHGLEEKNLLTSYEEEVLGKVRKYYSITREGRKVLVRKEEEWKEYSQTVLQELSLPPAIIRENIMVIRCIGRMARRLLRLMTGIFLTR